MPHYWMLNQEILDTTGAISDEIKKYCEAMYEVNKDAKEPHAFVAPVIEKGVPQNFAKVGTTRKEAKHIRDLDISLPERSSESLDAIAIGLESWSQRSTVLFRTRVREHIRSE